MIQTSVFKQRVSLLIYIIAIQSIVGRSSCCWGGDGVTLPSTATPHPSAPTSPPSPFRDLLMLMVWASLPLPPPPPLPL